MSPLAFLTALMGPAAAQTVTPAVPDLDAQLYRTSIDAQATLWTDDTGDSAAAPWKFRAMGGYVDQPLVFRDTDGAVTPAMDGALGLELMGGWQTGPFRLGVRLPTWFVPQGQLVTGGAGIGDLGVDGRVTLFDKARAPLGFALAGAVTAPTHTLDAPLGSDGVTWSLGVIADRHLGPLLLAANAGTRGVPRTDMAAESWDDHFYARVGAGWSIFEDGGISADFAVQKAYVEAGPAGLPAELLVGAWGRISDGFVLRGGAGTGVSEGIGAPRARAVLGISYEPRVEPPAPMTVAAPEPAPAPPPEPVATEGTIKVVVTDLDGKRIPATWELDGDGRRRDVEEKGRHVVDPGDHEVTVRAEGYGTTQVKALIEPGAEAEIAVSLAPAKVILLGDRIQILDKVYFETAKATIRPESHALLDQVAQTLLDNPQVARVRIEGHTDSRGSELANLELSKERAAAVLSYLLNRGVDPARLTSTGLGESAPLDGAENEDAWTRNRRVEFHIEAWAEEQ